MEPTSVRCVTMRTQGVQRESRGGWVRCAGMLRATALTLVAIAAFAACGGNDAPVAPLSPPDDTNELDEAEMPGAAMIAPTPLTVVTYEGSGQLVHPDAAVFPRRWQGKRYWVSATPYPGGNPKFENPSIYQGRYSNEMNVPGGATNPLVQPPTSGYLSDPDLLYDPDRDELRMYYRSTSGSNDQLALITSANGVTWSAPTPVLTGARYSLISPAIVRESATSWRMWTVNATAQGCFSLESEMALEQRRSSDGIGWGAAQPVNLRISGRVPWHLDVQYVPAKQEYWALVAAYPEGTTCAHTAVYFAQSRDGTTWKVAPTPLLAAGEVESLRDLVYRSSFRYHEGSDAVTVWFSGARLDGGAFIYSVASARYPFADLLRRVSGAIPLILDRESGVQPSPELRAARAAFEQNFP